MVFGCGGDRDKEKRPVMGSIASRLADAVWITTDNPRSEAPEEIAKAIMSGVSKDSSHRVRFELDRRIAIREALTAAQSAADTTGSGHIVLIAGKGHETKQVFGGPQNRKIVVFDDREVVRSILKDQRKTNS